MIRRKIRAAVALAGAILFAQAGLLSAQAVTTPAAGSVGATAAAGGGGTAGGAAASTLTSIVSPAGGALPGVVAGQADLAAAAPQLLIRLKDIAYIQGIRENQLTGLGLLTGLAGKGDTSGSGLLQRVVQNLVSAFGVQVPENEIRSRNCAVVMVTAVLPPFAHPGDRIPVTVSSIGDATDLTGGILLQTNLRAANDQVYAVAQGPVADSRESSPKTVGDVPDAALVEKGTTPSFIEGGKVEIVLRNPDFITASAAVDAIAKAFPQAGAVAVNPSLIEVTIPADRSQDPVGFIAGLEKVTLTPDPSNTVVINPRSGVVVVGQEVRIGKVAVSYKDTHISIGDISSPYLDEMSSKKDPFVLNQTTTVDDLVSVLKDAGVGPDAIIEILKAVARAGALYGKLVVM